MDHLTLSYFIPDIRDFEILFRSYVVAPTLPDHQQTDLNIQIPGNEQHIILTEVSVRL